MHVHACQKIHEDVASTHASLVTCWNSIQNFLPAGMRFTPLPSSAPPPTIVHVMARLRFHSNRNITVCLRMKSVNRCRPQLRSFPCPPPSVATLPIATFLDKSCIPCTNFHRRRQSTIKLLSIFCCPQATSYRAMSNSVPPTVRLISVIQIKYSQIKPSIFGLHPSAGWSSNREGLRTTRPQAPRDQGEQSKTFVTMPL
jgi:hypothetical protein